MYVLLLAVLVSVALGLVRSGRHRRSRGRVRAGFSLLAATVLFFTLLSFWGEMLWFDALGQGDRFWTMVWARAGTFVVATGLGAIGVRLLTWQIDIGWRSLRRAPVWIGGAGGAFLGHVASTPELTFAEFEALASALIAFGWGALAGAMTAGSSYLSQICFSEVTKSGSGRARVAGEIFRVIAVALAFFGYGVFVYGLYTAASAFGP